MCACVRVCVCMCMCVCTGHQPSKQSSSLLDPSFHEQRNITGQGTSQPKHITGQSTSQTKHIKDTQSIARAERKHEQNRATSICRDHSRMDGTKHATQREGGTQMNDEASLLTHDEVDGYEDSAINPTFSLPPLSLPVSVESLHLKVFTGL